MAGALPVAGVGLGDQQKFGFPRVRNAAWTVVPQGWASARVALTHSVHYPDQRGAAVWFAFDQPYAAPAGAALNVAFHFSGDTLAAGVTRGDSAQFGLPGVANAARTLAPQGFAPLVVGRAGRVWAGVENNGAARDFAFEAEYAPLNPRNTAFYFGGTMVVTAATVGDASRFGSIERIKKPPQLFAAGWQSSRITGKPRVGATGSVDFTFDGTAEPAPSAANTAFYLGPGQPLTPSAGDSAQFGWPGVRNLAATVGPQSIAPPSILPAPKVFDVDTNGATADFDFVQAYLKKPPALNTPFYFAWERRAFADGWQSTAFGHARAWLFHSYAYPQGWPSATFGQANVENWAEFAATPYGIPPSGAGVPRVEIAPRYPFTLAGVMPTLSAASATVRYLSLADRPVVARRAAPWQLARPAQQGWQHAQQDAGKSPAGWRGSWNPTTSALQGVKHRLPPVLRSGGMPLQHRQHSATALAWVTPIRQQDAAALWQHLRALQADALPAPVGLQCLQQDGDRSVRASRHTGWQVAVALATPQGNDYQSAQPSLQLWVGRFQTARVPPPGITGSRPPTEPPIDPSNACYSFSPQLVFGSPAASDGLLLFQCDGSVPLPPPAGGTVVIAIQRIYLVINHCTLKRVTDNATVPTVSMSLRLDAGSWVWGFEATLPGAAQALVEPTSAGPVELSAWVNRTEFRVLAEQVSRDRTFGQTVLRVSGRGRQALLDAPYAPQLSFNNPQARTHQQLFDDVLTLNGIPLGWSIDYGLEAWNVPAGVFAHQGTYVSALTTLARAGGAYLIPHPSASSFQVRPLYPAAPWHWGEVTPDFILPSAAVSRESIAWKDKPAYNRVFVSGQEQGVLGQVTRAGTAGDVLAPMVTDSLITTAAAARQRGLAILSDTGRQLEVGLRLPVLPATGVIQPGAFVQYQEEGDAGGDQGIVRLGLVRSTSVEVGWPEVYQSLGVECHA